MDYKLILLVLALVALTYFTSIRPQNRANIRKQRNLEMLREGDQIITMGGFYATIVEKHTVEYIIAMEPDNIRMKISPRAIAVFPDEIEKARQTELKAQGTGRQKS